MDDGCGEGWSLGSLEGTDDTMGWGLAVVVSVGFVDGRKEGCVDGIIEETLDGLVDGLCSGIVVGV